MRKKKVLAASLTTMALLLLPVGAASATTAAPSSEPEANESVMPMNIGGYDKEVAEANGFEIVTDADGSERSVPVTPEAKAIEAEMDSSGAVVPFGTAVGNCGSSFVTATKLSNDVLAVTTGFTVKGPVHSRNWQVNATGFITGAVLGFDGGTSAPVWSGQGSAIVVGPGIANVPLTAYAVLVTGAVCYSAGPTDTFG